MSDRREGGSVSVSLDSPGMTALHRVGVAGLWMTLEALDRQPDLATALANWGAWERSERGVTLRWTDKADAYFAALLDVSFRLDPRGLVWFPALGVPTAYPAHAVLLQTALLNTFLQHGGTRKALSPTVLAGTDEDADQLPLTFRPFASYAHQRAAKGLLPGKTTALKGWNFPGGAVRHSDFSATALAEPLERYLALLYAPVAAFYFRLRPRALGLQPSFCLVLPDVEDLLVYARARRTFVQSPEALFQVAGGAAASLRVALLMRTAEVGEDTRAETLHAVEFGRVAWDTKQKYRVGVYEVRVDSSDALEPFRRATVALEPRLVQGTNGAFWSVPQTPELVARNLVAGQVWWSGFAGFVDDADRRKSVMGFERKGLAEMVQAPEGLGDSAAEVFVSACHEAWRRRLGMLAERAQRERIDFRSLASREFDERRISFARCKNATTLRAAVTDFWARAGGGLEPLQNGWRDVLPYLDERQWQAGRDLALLALASYKPRNKAEQTAMEGAQSVDTDTSDEETV